MADAHQDKRDLEIRNEERVFIGRQLHDCLSNNILKLQYKILSLRKSLNENEYKNLLTEVENIRKDIRNISHVYCSHPQYTETIEKFMELKEEIKFLLIDFTDIYSEIVFFYNTFPKKNKIKIPKKRIENIILSLQELILNAIKHGNSTEINVNLTEYKNEIIIILEDNGKGFNKNSNTKGVGLRNVKERMKLIGGTFIIESIKGNGTVSTLSFPNL